MADCPNLERRGFIRGAAATAFVAVAPALLGGCKTTENQSTAGGPLMFASATTESWPLNSKQLPTVADIIHDKILITTPPADKVLVFHAIAALITTTDGRHVARALSGCDMGMNNPAATHEKNVGMLPIGLWAIGNECDGPTLKRRVMPLTGVYDPTSKKMTNKEEGRKQICWHKAIPGDGGSYGCLITSEDVFDAVAHWVRSGRVTHIRVEPT